MAKKKARASRKRKKTKSSKTSAKLKIKKEEIQVPRRISKTASSLTIIASAILALYGIFALIFSNEIILWLKENLGPSSTLTQSTLITHGVSWLILSILMIFSNKEIRKTSDKSWMWFLLVLSISAIVLFLGKSVGAVAVCAGMLALIASIIHLTKK
jgi:hypothetical protein